MGTFKDLTGKRFTRLVALCRVGKIGDAAVWRCRCDCGVERRVAITQLTSGHTKSCGCLRIERFVRQATRHGDYVGDRPTRLNRIWSVMRGCCQSPSKRGNYYQTHGITVCKAWGDYRAFKKWALANGYTDELNLDRIDRRRDFSPLNCHWVAGPAWRYNANRRPVIRSDGKVSHFDHRSSARRRRHRPRHPQGAERPCRHCRWRVWLGIWRWAKWEEMRTIKPALLGCARA